MTQHDYISKRFGTVSDKVHALERRRQLAVFDEVALGQREDEIAIGDVDLPASELLRKNPVFHASYDVLGLVFSGQEDGVRHTRHGVAGEAFAASVARRRLFEMTGTETI